ncbi:chromogranin B [Sesbania bispinosa]|nr:chromogranin B [Sesbania bispinosa]
MLSRDVIQATATALCSGNNDCTHPSSGAILVKKNRPRGAEEEAGLEKEEARTLDLIAYFMEEVDVLCAILLHAVTAILQQIKLANSFIFLQRPQ